MRTLLIFLVLITIFLLAFTILVLPGPFDSGGNRESVDESLSFTDSEFIASIQNAEKLHLNFVGDIMAHPPNFRMTDYNRIYTAVRQHLLEDDFSFANLEFVIDNNRAMSGYPRFNVHIDYAQAAVDAGFDVFSMANNHINDFGASGILQSRLNRNRLIHKTRSEEGRQLYFSGTRREAEDGIEIETIHHGELKIGFLAITGIVNQYGSGTAETYLVSFWDKEANAEFIAFLERETPSYDLFVLSYHGGNEYWLEPDTAKAELFQTFVNSGVDIVWGHHPHVLQPWELITREDGSNALIMYSMGNFVSSQPSRLSSRDWNEIRAFTGDSAIIQVFVDVSTGEAVITEVVPHLITHLQNFEIGQVELADGTSYTLDGFEVHYTKDVAGQASPSWKVFYTMRLNQMQEHIGLPAEVESSGENEQSAGGENGS